MTQKYRGKEESPCPGSTRWQGGSGAVIPLVPAAAVPRFAAQTELQGAHGSCCYPQIWRTTASLQGSSCPSGRRRWAGGLGMCCAGLGCSCLCSFPSPMHRSGLFSLFSSISPQPCPAPAGVVAQHHFCHGQGSCSGNPRKGWSPIHVFCESPVKLGSQDSRGGGSMGNPRSLPRSSPAITSPLWLQPPRNLHWRKPLMLCVSHWSSWLLRFPQHRQQLLMERTSPSAWERRANPLWAGRAVGLPHPCCNLSGCWNTSRS